MIKKTKPNPIGRKHKERIESWRSETVTFKIKWLRNKWKTDLTGKYYNIEDLQSFQFAHALPKWMYPEYRNNPSNIVYVDSIEQHQRVDFTIAWHKSIVESLIKKDKLIPRLREKWVDSLIHKNQWHIH
jgi:hypothetical protein